jgi:cytochrome b
MSGEEPIAVWDVPTRLFHWLLVILIGFSWWSAEEGELEWHKWSGMAVLGLLVFRIMWGVWGSSTARFANFVRGPGTVAQYLRMPMPATPGHNPLGALSVIAMLALLALQVITGLFAVDVDGIESGPLSYMVEFDQGRTAAEIHEIAFTLIQVLVVLHLLAIAFYLVVRRRNLVTPMVTGRDRALGGLPGMQPVPIWRLIVAIVVAIGLSWWLWIGAPL